MKNKFWMIMIILAAAVGTTAAPSQAKEWKGIDFPDQIEVDNTILVLNGLGLRQATALKVNVYIAGLYLTEKSGDPETILQSPTQKCLVLHFLRNVGSSDLTKAWDDGFKKNAANEIPVLKDRIEKIKGFTKDMKTGQKLSFTYKPGDGIKVDIDGALIGIVEGDDFAKAFLSIWLGPEPPNQNLKDGLLGAAVNK